MLFKPTKIRSYLAAMKARGHGAAAVLSGTRLDAVRLADPALLVEPWQRERVILNMLRLTNNAALGLELGASAHLADFGALAYAQMSSPSLRAAHALWQRYGDALGATIPVQVQDEGRHGWRVVYEVGQPDDPVGWFDAEEIVSMAVSLGPLLAGPAWLLNECTFSYARPPHHALYERYLRCPIRFGAAETALRPASPALDAPLPGSDPEFHEVCLRHLRQQQRQLSKARPVSSRLRCLLLQAPSSPPALADAAAYLGMSARSLRRHLLREGSSYHALVNQVRLDLACEYLQAERRPVKDVSFSLGFRSGSAFRRAFRSWTGRSVEDFLAPG